MLGDQLDDIGFADAGGTDQKHIVFDAPHHLPGRRAALALPLDAIEMGADLGGQDGLGRFLADDVAVQISDQIFGFEVEIDAGRSVDLFACAVHVIRVGHHHGAHDLDMTAEALGEEFADFFFDFGWVGNFFIDCFHGPVIVIT